MGLINDYWHGFPTVPFFKFSVINPIYIKGNPMRDFKKNFWGVGNIGEGFVSTVTSTYFILFLTDTAMLPLGIVSLIALIGSIMDFLLVPVSGAIIVSSKPMRWGRYRSWLLVCPPLVVLFYLLCFTVVEGSVLLTSACALLGYVGGKVAWNMVYASNVSLTAILTRGAENKTRLSSQRMMGSNIGRLLGNSLTPAIVAAVAVHLGEVNGYRITILIMGSVYILTCLMHFYISSKQKSSEDEPLRAQEKFPVSEIIKVVLVEPKLLITLIIDLTSNIASLVLPSLAVYYYKYCAGAPAMVSTHMLIIGFGGLAGASVVRILGKRVNNTKPILMCLYGLVAASLLSIQVFPDSMLYFLVIGALISLITGMTQPFELTLYMNTAASYRRKTGKDATGFIMGLSNLPVKFASVIKSTLIPFTLAAVGYVANAEPTPEMQQAIVNAYTLIPPIFPVLGILLLGFAYKMENLENS